MMLRLATAADPVIDRTAVVLGEEATQLRGSLLDVRKTRLSHAKTALDSHNEKPAADADKATAQRTKLVADVAAAATAVNQARAIRTDFSPLARSHHFMLEALRDPHADVTSSVTEAQAFQDALKTMTALAPAAAGKPADDKSGDKSSDKGSHDDSDG